MPLPNILKKASSYILGDGGQDSRSPLYQDGEVLFCKNNVCVHPPTMVRQHCDVVHHPGYLTVTCRFVKNDTVPTLHLSWIPNSTLRKHPTTLEKSLSRKFDGFGKELDLEYQRQISEESCDSRLEYDPSAQGGIDVCLEVKEPVNCGDCERVCSGGYSKEIESRINKYEDNNCKVKTDSEADDRKAENGVEKNNPESTNQNSVSLDKNATEKPDNSKFSKSEDARVENESKESGAKSIDSANSSVKLATNNEIRVWSCDGESVKSRSMSLTSTSSLMAATDGTFID